MKPVERSIVNRLFDIREELEELTGTEDALYLLINAAIGIAIKKEHQGLIPSQRQESVDCNSPLF